jgi:hypothetical protein
MPLRSKKSVHTANILNFEPTYLIEFLDSAKLPCIFREIIEKQLVRFSRTFPSKTYNEAGMFLLKMLRDSDLFFIIFVYKYVWSF